MTDLLAALLTFGIVIYGLLVIIGSGPWLANKASTALARTVLTVVRLILRQLLIFMKSLFAGMLEFVFHRPRR